MVDINRTLLIFTFLTGSSVLSQRGSNCITPNGENAKCVPITFCWSISNAIQTKNQTALQFAQDSSCGLDEDVPLVCCGVVGYPKSNSSTPEKVPGSLEQSNKLNLPDSTVCGLETEDYRIFGGEETELKEFPWMALLGYKLKGSGELAPGRCGGSLINNRYVLTAAHCLSRRDYYLANVRLGEWNTTSDPDCQSVAGIKECADPIVTVNVEKEIPHPHYSILNKINDIGLVKLAKDVKYTDYIRPICLPPQDSLTPAYNTLLTVVGWGTTENGTVSEVKLRVDVPLRSNSVCIEKLGRIPITTTHLCAGGERGKDACRGDSGGPLMRMYEDEISKRKQWFQEGIVSTGVGCGTLGFPAIYTRTSIYTNWIISQLS